MDEKVPEISEILQRFGLRKTELSRLYNIPYKTIQNWTTTTAEHRVCPEYVRRLIVIALESRQAEQ